MELSLEAEKEHGRNQQAGDWVSSSQRTRNTGAETQVVFLTEDEHQSRVEQAYFLPVPKHTSMGTTMAAALPLQDLLTTLLILPLSNFSHVQCCLWMDLLLNHFQSVESHLEPIF